MLVNNEVCFCFLTCLCSHCLHAGFEGAAVVSSQVASCLPESALMENKSGSEMFLNLLKESACFRSVRKAVIFFSRVCEVCFLNS